MRLINVIVVTAIAYMYADGRRHVKSTEIQTESACVCQRKTDISLHSTTLQFARCTRFANADLDSSYGSCVMPVCPSCRSHAMLYTPLRRRAPALQRRVSCDSRRSNNNTLTCLMATICCTLRLWDVFGE